MPDAPDMHNLPRGHARKGFPISRDKQRRCGGVVLALRSRCVLGAASRSAFTSTSA